MSIEDGIEVGPGCATVSVRGRRDDGDPARSWYRQTWSGNVTLLPGNFEAAMPIDLASTEEVLARLPELLVREAPLLRRLAR